MDTRPILLFDGVCGLCNGLVDFLMRNDKRAHLRFATLQGQTGGEILRQRGITLPPDRAPETVILWIDPHLHERSDAIVRALAALGGIWTVFGWLRIIPRPLRDLIYRWVARNRYAWFGKRDTCRLPTPAERARFLS